MNNNLKLVIDLTKNIQERFFNVKFFVEENTIEDSIRIYHNSPDIEDDIDFNELFNKLVFEKLYNNNIYNFDISYNPSKVALGEIENTNISINHFKNIIKSKLNTFIKPNSINKNKLNSINYKNNSIYKAA